MFNQNFCGIVVQKDDIKYDAQCISFREIAFQEVHKNKKFDGRKIYVRVYTCIDINLNDMVYFQNYDIYKKDNINQIRLTGYRGISTEYQGNIECRCVCNREIYRRMECLQQRKRQFQTRLVQTRIEDYFNQ